MCDRNGIVVSLTTHSYMKIVILLPKVNTAGRRCTRLEKFGIENRNLYNWCAAAPNPPIMRECWNWQTGSVEVAMFARAYGFKSHLSHQLPFVVACRNLWQMIEHAGDFMLSV